MFALVTESYIIYSCFGTNLVKLEGLVYILLHGLMILIMDIPFIVYMLKGGWVLYKFYSIDEVVLETKSTIKGWAGPRLGNKTEYSWELSRGSHGSGGTDGGRHCAFA